MSTSMPEAKKVITEALTAGRFISRYAKRYSQHVADSLCRHDPSRMLTSGTRSDVFVDPILAPSMPAAASSGIVAGPQTGRQSNSSQQHSLDEILDGVKSTFLVIVGVAGSGKSTLLRQVARQMANSPRKRRTIPVLLLLRHHAKQIVNTEVSLPDLIRSSLPDLRVPEPGGWWDRKLASGNCLVLFDGLDEVSDAAARKQVVAWLERQQRTYPKNTYLVTSRPQEYEPAFLPAARVLQIRPFTDSQIRRLLRRWYQACASQPAQAHGSQLERAPEAQADELFTQLANSPQLRDLSTNPMLLTMIARVHRYRGELPMSRSGLYDEIFQAVLWQRQESKNLPQVAGDLPGISKEQLLAELAFTMMRRRLRAMTLAEILENLRPALKNMSSPVSPETFLAQTVSSGLLVEREPGRYSFSHHSFSEYLAARHIGNTDQGHLLVTTINDLWWRESTLFYLSHADADEIVTACLEARTIASMALALDCRSSGAKLANNLSKRLDQFQEMAFRDDASTNHRRLVAAVMATRYLSSMLPTVSGSRICVNPVLADLYWLFLRDTNLPDPDGPVLAPRPGRSHPATGMWGSDAAAFVAWINQLTGDRYPGLRLPTGRELDELAFRTGRAGRTHARSRAALTGAWMVPASAANQDLPDLWVPNNSSDPRIVSNDDLEYAARRDFSSSLIMRLALTDARIRAHVLGPVFNAACRDARDSTQDLKRARSLLGNVLADLKLGLILAPEHDPDRVPALHVAQTLATELAAIIAEPQDRSYQQEMRMARAQLDKFDRWRAIAAAETRKRHRTGKKPKKGVPPEVVGKAQQLQLSLRQAMPLSQVRELPVARSLALDTALEQLPNLRPGPTYDKQRARVSELALGSSLSRAVRGVHSSRTEVQRGQIAMAFVDILANRARSGWSAQTPVNFDLLAETLHHSCATICDSADTPDHPWAEQVAKQLASTAMPIFLRSRSLREVDPACIRLPAIALAAEAGHRGMPNTSRDFRTVAAGITLLEQRTTSAWLPEQIFLAR